MKKLVLCVLVLALVISAGCGGEPAPEPAATGGGSEQPTAASEIGSEEPTATSEVVSEEPTEAPAASSAGGEGKTLDPCALITDDEARAALGDEFTEVVADSNAGFVSCQWLGELKPGEGLPSLYIMAYTDQSLSNATEGETVSAEEFWNNFHGSLQDSMTERVSDTSYRTLDEMFGLEALIEEIPGLGEKALFFILDEENMQLWMFQDYAAFSLSVKLRPTETGLEKERLTAVAETILASMP